MRASAISARSFSLELQKLTAIQHILVIHLFVSVKAGVSVADDQPLAFPGKELSAYVISFLTDLVNAVFLQLIQKVYLFIISVSHTILKAAIDNVVRVGTCNLSKEGLDFCTAYLLNTEANNKSVIYPFQFQLHSFPSFFGSYR